MKRATNLLLVSTILCFACALTLSAQSFGGRATGINSAITINGSTSVVLSADTGQLVVSGGNLSVTSPSTAIPNILSTGSVSSDVSGALKSTIASSTVNNLDVQLPGVRIRANRILANASCICCPGGGDPFCSANTQIIALTLTDAAGVQTTVQVTGDANQVINLPNNLGTITINEQSSSLGSINVNGVHIRATQGTTVYNIIAASATAQIQCVSVAPVPAEVRVSGRILTAAGDPIPKAFITLTDAAGNTRETTSGGDGSYGFDNVEVGHSYIIQVAKKGFGFEPVLLNLTDTAVIDIQARP